MASSLIVVIPTSGRPDLLRRTLDSLSHCRKPAIYRKTVVIENGPKTDAEEVVRDYHTSLISQYLYEPIGNKSRALNKVLEREQDGLIFFTDDDARFDVDILCAYAEAAKGIQRGQFYGGPMGVDYEQEPPSWHKSYLPPSAIGLNFGSYRKLRSGDLRPFQGINWAAFAKDLILLGGFNPDLGPGSVIKSTGQEADMHRRLFDYGVQQVDVPEARVWHFVPTARCSPRWIIKRAYRQGVLRGYLYGRQTQTFMGFQFWMVKVWLKFIAKVLSTSLSGTNQTRFDALYNLALQSGKIQGVRKSQKNSLVKFFNESTDATFP